MSVVVGSTVMHPLQLAATALIMSSLPLSYLTARAIRLRLPLPSIRPLLIAGCVITLLTYALLGASDAQTQTAEAPMGQVSVQMAYSAAKVRAMVASWSPEQIALSCFALGVDVLFAVAYGLTLALLSAWLDLSVFFIACGIGAAIIDIAEGLLILYSILTPAGVTEAHALSTTLVASVKFLLICVAIYGAIARPGTTSTAKKQEKSSKIN